MAHTERNSALAGLKIDTSFPLTHRPRWRSEAGGRRVTDDGTGIEGDRTNIFHESGARRYGTDEDNSVLSSLHSATPPISVPRHDDHPKEDVSFPERPEDVQSSPLDSFLHSRRRSVSFDPNITLDSGQPQALGEPLAKGVIRTRPQRFQAKGSSLKNTLPQDEDDDHYPRHGYRAQRGFDSHEGFLSSPDDDMRVNSAIDRPTSLTSISTASPITEELRTPPEGSKGALPSPFCVASPVQGFASLDDRSSWSSSVITPFGSKTRGFRGSTRQSSRRSTASSGKSPASMFLSMWSSGEEPAPQPDDEGQMVGTEYVLGKQIGFGGFSTVKEAYKADETGGTKRLAVKIVRKQVSGKNEKENDEVQAEFDHEVRVWRYLSHPNVLTLDAVYETDYATFCFTKLAIGGTLFDLIRQNRRGLDMKLAKKYTYQLACALRYLHEDARVVHRDIKLENCLLDPIELPDGTKASNLVLCDFGMAEWMNIDNGGDSPDPYDDAADRPPPKTIGPAGSSTSVAGSLEYASPELLLSTSGVIEPSVDIWAFGVIAYTVLVGSRPFQDPFTPRVQSHILSGNWDRTAVLGDETDPLARRDREHALELIEGCLNMSVEKRWTIRDVLSSRWLRELSEKGEDGEADTIWKL
ncbi:kinase-like domain-containing protein [Aspergillus pseudotamarii]|uniref:Kinase-like domain-containing protein n=1 Tax=Aspergillus pseudotamarii TaxID=132259 RepID=A0A5N6SKT5_ASPPS|nr:kinase-like domain-containing protein [Aspergillus pseudotamarii]KAE8134529.1 kinase-like domain-containing protein [Aspergillus pseudotamarii]